MAAAEYYNGPRYRPHPPQYEPREPRHSRRPEHLPPPSRMERMEAHEDSPVEEIPRAFPPGEHYYGHHGHHPKRSSRRTRDYDPYAAAPPRRARSARGRYDDGYGHDDRRSHRSDRHRPSRYDEPSRFKTFFDKTDK